MPCILTEIPATAERDALSTLRNQHLSHFWFPSYGEAAILVSLSLLIGLIFESFDKDFSIFPLSNVRVDVPCVDPLGRSGGRHR